MTALALDRSLMTGKDSEYDLAGLQNHIEKLAAKGKELTQADVDRFHRTLTHQGICQWLKQQNQNAEPHRWIDEEDFFDEIDFIIDEEEIPAQSIDGGSRKYVLLSIEDCESAAHHSYTEDQPQYSVHPHDGLTYGSTGCIELHYPEDHPRSDESPYASIPLDEDCWDDDHEPIASAIGARLAAGDGTYGYALDEEFLFSTHYVDQTLTIRELNT